MDPPKTNSHNNNNLHSHDQVAAVNIHHHYHHGAGQDVDQKYYRKEGDGVNGVYLNDDDIFKRETVPNSAGKASKFFNMTRGKNNYFSIYPKDIISIDKESANEQRTKKLEQTINLALLDKTLN